MRVLISNNYGLTDRLRSESFFIIYDSYNDLSLKLLDLIQNCFHDFCFNRNQSFLNRVDDVLIVNIICIALFN